MRIGKPFPSVFSSGLVLGLLFWLGMAGFLNADDSITLKYTDRPDQTQTALLKDGHGRSYLPLADLAKFYGVDFKFDAQNQRVFLSKNKNQVNLLLSQPMFLVLNPTQSFPTDPAEEVDGQLAVTPGAAEDLLTVLLGVNTRFLSDRQTFIAGEIPPNELKNEIIAQEQQQTMVPTPLIPNTQSAEPPATTEDEVVNARGEEETDQVSHVEEPTGDSRGYHVRCIVIDPGHGGKDIGARGYDNRYSEKQATLAIATKVTQLLRQHPGFKVLMTRDSDYFVTLKGRTQFANRHNADLFVSIHCNSTPRSKANEASGTEIWIFSPKSSNHYASFEASRENAGGDNLGILSDLHYQVYYLRSIAVAERVWEFINRRLGQHMRKVQQANFYVLGKVDMPSILIETAFISNPREEAKLRDPNWQDKIAGSIADGILAYRDAVEGNDGVEQAQR